MSVDFRTAIPDIESDLAWFEDLLLSENGCSTLSSIKKISNILETLSNKVDMATIALLGKGDSRQDLKEKCTSFQEKICEFCERLGVALSLLPNEEQDEDTGVDASKKQKRGTCIDPRDVKKFKDDRSRHTITVEQLDEYDELFGTSTAGSTQLIDDQYYISFIKDSSGIEDDDDSDTFSIYKASSKYAIDTTSAVDNFEELGDPIGVNTEYHLDTNTTPFGTYGMQRPILGTVMRTAVLGNLQEHSESYSIADDAKYDDLDLEDTLGDVRVRIQKLAGIEWGRNRCYFNATIKAVMSCESFILQLRDAKARCHGDRGELAKRLLRVYEELQTGQLISQRRPGFENNPSSIDSVAIWIQKMNPTAFLSHEAHQDAGELLVLLLVLLDLPSFTYQQLNTHELPFSVNSMDASLPEKCRMLPVYLSSGLDTLQAAFNGVSQKQELNLSTTRSALLSEEERATFDAFVQEHALHDQLIYPVPSVSTQRFIEKAPGFLPIQITRFSEQREKAAQHVTIPYRLYISVSQTANKGEEHVLDAHYVLRSVIVHSGTVNCGHYRAYVAHPDTAEDKSCSIWVQHNDAAVSIKRFQDIKPNIETDGYIAFYEKVLGSVQKYST